MIGFVYHIPDPESEEVSLGYVGVVLKKRGLRRRFVEHSRSKSPAGRAIREKAIEFSSMKTLFEGPIEECYEMERRLRPNPFIGWNQSSGGSGFCEGAIDEVKRKIKSRNQSERMKNPSLKAAQSETFRRKYYSSSESIELRSRRAKEHMADPEKKDKCLQAIHKKVKCPHCDYESNVGNVALHIKRKHS